MSEPWAINAGKASTAIGTATIESDDNLLTIAGHGLGDGDTVTVDTLTGGGSALTADAVYFVRDATTDDFALSLTLHGPQIEFASDGGADVYHFAPQYTAAELRRLNGGGMTKESTRLGARSGIHPANDPPISVSGTTWTVHDLTADFDVGLSADDGPYRVAHLEKSGSLTPADGSSDRIDALDLQIQDDDTDASGFRRTRVVYVTGTPGSGSAPAVTSNALRLGTILVPSGGSPSPSVSDDAEVPYTVASGGTVPVRDDTEGPVSPYHGQVRYRRDTNVLEAWDAGEARWSFLSSLGGWHEIAAGFEDDVSTFDIDLTAGGRFPLETFKTFRLRAWGRPNSAGETEIFVRINDISSSVYYRAVGRIATPTDTVDAESGLGPQWEIGSWGGGGGVYNPLEITISTLSDICMAHWQITDTENHLATQGGGRINAVAPVTEKITLFIGTGAGSQFQNIRWELEGYIPHGFIDPFSGVGPH